MKVLMAQTIWHTSINKERIFRVGNWQLWLIEFYDNNYSRPAITVEGY